jgi:predicted regulator of Ras-like GTPase activity (Roadblock/LC7/MglB family)
MLIEEPRKSREGRVMVLSPKLDFNVIKGLVVLSRPGLDGVVLRRIRLNNDAARVVATASTPCHLTQQLKGTLSGTEVRQMQAKVSQDHTNQGHVGQMQPLCDHLSPHQYLGFPPGEAAKYLIVGTALSRCVTVPAQCLNSKRALHFQNHTLGAQTKEADVGTPTLRAVGHCAVPSTTLMAYQAVALGVVRKGRLASTASEHMTAITTLNSTRRSSAVEEENRLLPVTQGFFQRIAQGATEDAANSGLQFLPHIHNFHFREVCDQRAHVRPGANPVRQC